MRPRPSRRPTSSSTSCKTTRSRAWTPISSPLTDSGNRSIHCPRRRRALRRSGYISTTYQPAEGERSGGVSSVLLFETEAGARDWMAYETSDEALRHQIPGSKIKRFQVLDVPGAHGWTGPDLHGNAIGHVYWTQGRCMMSHRPRG